MSLRVAAADCSIPYALSSISSLSSLSALACAANLFALGKLLFVTVTKVDSSVVILLASVVQFPVIPGDVLVVVRLLPRPVPIPSSLSGSVIITEFVPVAFTTTFLPSAFASLFSAPLGSGTLEPSA